MPSLSKVAPFIQVHQSLKSPDGFIDGALFNRFTSNI